MKINLKKVISIMILIIAFEVVYLIGFYMPNKVAYGNSEDEICGEIPTEISVSNSDLENENPICDAENNFSEEEIVEEEIEIVDSEPTLEDILINECPFVVIDELYEIDSYEEGNWYCYYIYADGDIYVVTLKNDHVDVCVQLN